MLIIPAIDLKDGKVVRLVQGKFLEITVYSEDPVAVARDWVVNGASLLHVVDLDGAVSGQIRNMAAIESIVKSAKVPIQVGGGIRNKETILDLFKIGVSKVVLGTRAVEDKAFLQDVIATWRERIIVSIDSSHGMVLKHGWTASTMVKAVDLAREVQKLGASSIIYTDISRDGTLRGPNTEGITSLLTGVETATMKIFASGGISNLDDIIALKKLESFGLAGVVVGKALYEGKLLLREAITHASAK